MRLVDSDDLGTPGSEAWSPGLRRAQRTRGRICNQPWQDRGQRAPTAQRFLSCRLEGSKGEPGAQEAQTLGLGPGTISPRNEDEIPGLLLSCFLAQNMSLQASDKPVAVHGHEMPDSHEQVGGQGDRAGAKAQALHVALHVAVL